MVMARAQGFRTWLIQRLSAVYMVAYMMFFLMKLIVETPLGYMEWRRFIAEPFMSVATLLLFFLLLMHAWVGMRDVAMDYLHDFKLRFTVLSFIATGLLGMGAWVLLVLMRVS